MSARSVAFSDPPCIDAHKHSSRHRSALETSDSCGCYFCFRTFVVGDVIRWIDDNQTALCPKCGIDAVIGSSSGIRLDDAFLRRMHRQWFAGA